jgi:hypothetical protein
MRNRFVGMLFTLCIVVGLVPNYFLGAAVAAKLSTEFIQAQNMLVVTIEGSLEKGDIEVLKRTVAKEFPGSKENFCGGNDLVVVQLDSEGGNYAEGIRLGKQFKDNCYATFIKRNSHCFSACALAFMGGTASGAEGTTLPSRAIEIGAKLGFHAPSFPRVQGSAASSILHELGVSDARLFYIIAGDLEIPKEFVDEVLAYKKDQIRIVSTARDLLLLKIALHSEQKLKELTVPMVENYCENMVRFGRAINSPAPYYLERPSDYTEPVRSFIDTNSDFFGPEAGPVTRSNVYFSQELEGFSIYCVVDHSKVGDNIHVFCQGLQVESDNSAAFDKAVANILGNSGRLSADCDSINVADPFAFMIGKTIVDEDIYFFVEDRTTIGEIESIFNAMQITSEKLTVK